MKDIQIKTLEFKIEEATTEDNDGVIEGLAAAFKNVDQGMDRINKGAFKKTLKENGQHVPILDSHRPDKQIGWNETAVEVDKGLRIKGLIDLNVQAGKEKFSLAQKAKKVGAKMGLSIGYSTVKFTINTDTGVRDLNELKLHEYSIVTFPMNTSALITAAKSWAQGLEDKSEIDSMIAGFYLHLQNLGYDNSKINDALLLKTKEAAAKTDDPHGILQSLEKCIANFER